MKGQGIEIISRLWKCGNYDNYTLFTVLLPELGMLTTHSRSLRLSDWCAVGSLLSRAFMQILATVLVVCGLVGCGGSEGKTRDSAAEAVVEARTLSLYSWGEYVAQEVLDQFTTETGIEIVYLTYGSSEEMFAGLESDPSNYDVIILESVDVETAAEQGFLKPLDYGALPNFEGIERTLCAEIDSVEWRHSIPYLWGTTVVAYREEITGEPTGSWDMIFGTTGDYRIGMLEDPYDTWGAVLHYLGKAEAPWKETSLLRGAEVMLELGASREVSFADDLGVMEALRNREVGAAMIYSGDAALLADEDEGIDYFVPREGAQVWTDVVAVSQGCSDPASAHAFINFLARPDISALNAEEAYYAPPVGAAMGLMSQELLDDQRIFPPEETLTNCHELPDLTYEQRAFMSRAMGEFKRLVRSRGGETER